jgi:Ca-activated chloride channel homolog
MISSFQFRYPHYLYLLLMLVPVGMLFYWLIERRRQQLVRFMGRQVEQFVGRTIGYYRLRAGILLLAVAMGIVAMARPQWGRYQDNVATRGIDVIIAVDVSLSMLSDDESPSRLARARRLSADLVDRLRENRIGLIAFAGSSAALMPLTLDTAALKTFIDALDPRVVDDPGSSIVQAIRRATQSFKSVGRQSRVMILISDGEDQSDEPLDNVRSAAAEAGDNGVLIISIGIGTTKGSTIPLDGVGASGFKHDSEGKLVQSKLEEAVLQTAAETSRGIYLRAQPDGEEATLVSTFVDRLSKGEFSDRLTRDREERYQYPLAAAMALLLVDSLLLLYRPKV